MRIIFHQASILQSHFTLFSQKVNRSAPLTFTELNTKRFYLSIGKQQVHANGFASGSDLICTGNVTALEPLK